MARTTATACFNVSRRGAAALPALLAAACLVATAHAATKSFIGGAAGAATDWHVPGNWSPPGVPTSSDDVIIDVNDVVTLSWIAFPGETHCRTLECEGTMTVTTNTIFFEVSAHLGAASHVVLKHGGFAGPSLTIDGYLEMGAITSGSGLSGGPVVISETGVVELTDGAPTAFEAPVTNDGMVIWKSSRIGLTKPFVNNGVFDAQPSFPGEMNGYSGEARFENNGLVTIATTVINAVNVPFDNHNTVMLTGALTLGGEQSGSFITSAGSVLTFRQPTTYLPGFEVVGDASLGIVGDWPFPVNTPGTVTLGISNIPGDLVASALVVALPNGNEFSTSLAKIAGNATVGSLSLDAPYASLQCDGTLTVSGEATFGRGILKADKVTTLAGSSLSLVPGMYATTEWRVLDCDMELFGTTKWTGKDTRLAGKTITNHGTFTVDWSTTNDSLELRPVEGTSGSRVVNHGEFVKQGAGTFVLSGFLGGVFFEQRGTVSANKGMMQVLGGTIQAGLIDGADGQLKVSGGQEYESTVDLAGSPIVTLVGGTIPYPRPIDFDGTLILDESTMTVAGNMAAKSITCDASMLEVFGDASATAELDVTFGGAMTIHGSGFFTNGTVRADSVLFADDGASFATQLSIKRGRIDGGPSTTAKLVFAGGSGVMNSTVACDLLATGQVSWISANIELDDAVLTLAGGVLVSASPLGLATLLPASSSSTHVVRNLGDWKQGGVPFINSSGTATIAAEIEFFNEGSITLNKGSLTLGNGTHTGTIGGLSTGTIVLKGAQTCAAGVAFVGEPNIVLSAGTFVHAGAPTVGGSLSLADGATAAFAGLAVNGTLSLAPGTAIETASATFGSASTLLLTVGVASGDEPTTGVVNVAGPANLAGVVKVALGDGVGPAPCEVFTFLAAETIGARFAGAGAIGPGTAVWHLLSTASDVSVVHANGDLDASGVLDVGDIAALLESWGRARAGADAGGDLTCDGNVDGADLGLLLAAIGR